MRDLSVPPTKFRSADEAVETFVKSGNRVYIHMAAANPVRLTTALANLAKAGKVKDIECVSMSLNGPAPHADPAVAHAIRSNVFFIGDNLREAVNSNRADFNPVFFSEVPLMFRRGIVPIDVAFVHISPPDQHGWCSMGVSVDCSLAAVQTAKYVIGQVNPNMPRTHGDGLIHINHLDAIVECDDPIIEVQPAPLTEVDIAIGKHVASLVPDGACLQMGIGNIPNAVLAQLVNHKDLGVHTELFSDGVIPLVEKGVINNRMKKTHPGKIVGTFVFGSRKFYDFVDDNPAVNLLDVSYVNDPHIISRNNNVIAINSAIEVDITGQVCADSIGTRIYSGIGGQMDFMRGAARSVGGKPIIAIPSQTHKGLSRIVATLKEGASVTTTRAHVHYVVTEYGIAELYGKNMRERAAALIAIAHPNHRPALYDAAVKRFGSLPQVKPLGEKVAGFA